MVFTFPVAVKTYLLSFTCNSYDIVEEEEELKIMAASLSVECVHPLSFSLSEPHGGIKVIGLVALLIVTPLILISLYMSIYPIRHLLENRTKRKCSPLVDFIISRW
jgi:hypothetical protein